MSALCLARARFFTSGLHQKVVVTLGGSFRAYVATTRIGVSADVYAGSRKLVTPPVSITPGVATGGRCGDAPLCITCRPGWAGDQVGWAILAAAAGVLDS